MPTSDKKVTSAQPSGADAILQALKFVANATKSAPHASRELHNELPTALFRTAIETLAGHKTYEAFEATKPNLRALLRDALNWSGHGRATKAVNKALTQAMSGTDEEGRSTYPQAIEMLSFLAVCAPILEPDRLARIAELAATTPNAYAPILYPTTLSTQLRTLLRSFPDSRKEQLLATLWISAHDGRWWDNDDVFLEEGRPRRRRRQQIDPEQREASAEQVEDLLAGNTHATVELLAQAFATNTLPYSEEAVDAITELEVTTESARATLRDARRYTDPDIAVLLSYIKESFPLDRPASPIPEMVNNLKTDLADTFGVNEPFPEKPETWYELHPAASMQSFPISASEKEILKRLFKEHGITGRLVGNAAQLRNNADFMGNCTFSYRQRCESGRVLMGYLTDGTGHYNFSITKGQEGPHLSEVNSRFNRGAVPQHVQDLLNRYVAELSHVA